MKRKIHFDLFSTAWFNGEPINANKEKRLCPLAAVVQQQGYRGKFLLLSNASIGKSSNIESLKLHLIAHNRLFCYFNLNKLNVENLKKPINLPKDCIVILDSLDEVQKTRMIDEKPINIRDKAEAFVNSFMTDKNISCIIVASRFNPSATKIEGYSNNFLKGFEEIALSELTSDQMDILVEKFKLNVERDSFAYTLFKTPMYLSMAVEMGGVDKAIEDEASFIDAYLNKLHQIKQSQNDKKDSFIDGSLLRLAYETVRGRTYSKDISIPTAFNTIFDLVIAEDGTCALGYYSIRYVNFCAAKYILNEIERFYENDEIDEKRIKRLLDFSIESDNLECLRFCGELLRHKPECENIVKALNNAEELKQDTEWYYNLCLIIILCYNEIRDTAFALGNCFCTMYFKRNSGLCKAVVMYSDLSRYIFYDYWRCGAVLKVIQSRTSKYIKKTTVEDVVYIGCDDNPFAVFAGYKYEKEYLTIKNGCKFLCDNGNRTEVAICGHYKKSTLRKIVVEDKNLAYKSIDGVLFSSDMKRLIKYPGGQVNTRYKVPETVEIIEAGAFAGCCNICDIVLPLNLREIGREAFSSCESLRQITIPSSVVRINDFCFSNCTSLKNILLPFNLSYIGEGAFSHCDSLEKICLPESVADIGEDAFHGCDNLLQFNIPIKIEIIRERLLTGAKRIKSLVIPQNVKRIESGAFYGLDNLKKIYIHSNNIVFECKYPDFMIGFINCTNLETVYLPLQYNISDEEFRKQANLPLKCIIIRC